MSAIAAVERYGGRARRLGFGVFTDGPVWKELGKNPFFHSRGIQQSHFYGSFFHASTHKGSGIKAGFAKSKGFEIMFIIAS